MKVIDLLNKIANGEEVPEKIKWEDTIYAYSDYDKDYLEFPFSEEEYQGLFCMKDSILTQYLNDTVEIIEEQKKIPEKLDYCEENTFMIKCKENSYLTREEIRLLDSNFKELGNKINSIIDYLESKGDE